MSCHERRIVGRRLRERAGDTETADAHSEECGSADNGSTTQPDHFVLLGFVSNYFEASPRPASGSPVQLTKRVGTVELLHQIAQGLSFVDGMNRK
jgi:hypothetical protein